MCYYYLPRGCETCNPEPQHLGHMCPINQQCTESLHIDTIAPSPELRLSIVCSILVRFSQNPLPYVCKSIALTEDMERPFLLQVTFPASWVFLLKPSNRLVHPGSGPSMKFLDCLRPPRNYVAPFARTHREYIPFYLCLNMHNPSLCKRDKSVTVYNCIYEILVKANAIEWKHKVNLLKNAKRINLDAKITYLINSLW